MTRLFERRYFADYLAGAYVLAYYGWLFTRTPGTPLTARIGDATFYPLGLAVGWACLRNLRGAPADRRTRVAWSLLGAQALLLWLIGISWPRLVSYFGPAAWPGWIGNVEILQHLLLVAALLSFPGRRIGPDERARFRLDVGLVLVAGFVLAFHFGLRLTLTKPIVGPVYIVVAQSVLDWVVFTAAAVGVLQKRDTTLRAVMTFQLVASVLYLFGNYTLYGMERYHLGDGVDGIWFSAWVFRWISARVAWHRYQRRSPAPEVDDRVLGYRSSLFSYVMLAGAFVLLMMQILAGDRRSLWLLASSSMLMAVLLLLRQVAELRENRRLFETQLAQLTERNELERQLHHAQKLDAVGHLAGGLAHDFNNVLTAIRGYAELLRDELPAGTAAAEDLAHIEQAVDRAAGVTGKLLAFSRKQPVQHVVLDLNSVLLGLEPLLRQLLTDRIQVSLETDPGLWRIKADPGQIEQVIINLTTNARDAMPTGGLVRIVTANRRIASPSAASGPLQPGDYAALMVVDPGTGMTDEVRQRIFEPFFSTKPKDRGVGLGLAMVHGIITHSGGHVSVESRPGAGSTFTILLPRTHDLAADPDAVPGAAPSGSRTVLLVDDESSVRTIARRLLERAGHEVLEAAGGAEALDMASNRKARIDLLLTDIVMPGLDGREVVTRFRRLRPGVPVVCMTGYAGEGGGGWEAAEGVRATVMKPFSAEALLRAVETACASPADAARAKP